MFNHPKVHEYLRQNGGSNRDLYKAMEKNDMSEVVMTAYDILKTVLLSPALGKKTAKSEEYSCILRKEGNKHFVAGKYNEAFNMYNSALLYAPNGSRALILAYSNKSALFHKFKKYQECIIDIDKCFALNCPKDLISKLKNRKEDAARLLKLTNIHLGYDYFKLKSVHNQIPCASKYLDITHELDVNKVVATTDIKFGTVLAVEQAFVSFTKSPQECCCYFCQKYSINLVPCDGCTCVIFCSEKCKDQCMTEYHKVECKIIDFVLTLEPKEILMLKSVIKLALSGTWEDFIEISLKIGVNKYQENSLKGGLDIQNRFSVLNLRNNTPFKYGHMYNKSFVCATLIRYLETIPLFLPHSSEQRLHAIRALARIMMFIVLNCTPHLIFQPVQINGMFEYKLDPSFGLYPFIENFKKSCEYNVTAAFIKNKMALITIRPIKCGTEITVPYVTHDFNMNLPRELKLIFSFKHNGDVCKMCAYNTHIPKSTQASVLSKYEKVFDQYLHLMKDCELHSTDLNLIFQRLCDTYTNLCHINEYDYETFSAPFLLLITLYQLYESQNILLR